LVELTMALHRVFDSPTGRDHLRHRPPAYVHKILTGRQDQFERLEDDRRAVGYPTAAESSTTSSRNSHASTALS